MFALLNSGWHATPDVYLFEAEEVAREFKNWLVRNSEGYLLDSDFKLVEVSTPPAGWTLSVKPDLPDEFLQVQEHSRRFATPTADIVNLTGLVQAGSEVEAGTLLAKNLLVTKVKSLSPAQPGTWAFDIVARVAA